MLAENNKLTELWDDTRLNEALGGKEYSAQYTKHLAEVNESKSVISCADIISDRGVLLCKKGTQINRRMTENLLQHKLSQPLETLVDISDSIKNEHLLAYFHQTLDKYPDLKHIHQALDAEKIIKERINAYKLPAILSQKLTVMHKQMPEQFDDSLLCAWLTSLICHEMKLDKTSCQTVWLASLFHDVGMLHLPPEVTQLSGWRTTEQWRALQAHPLIGKIILDTTPGVRHEVGVAIMQHHERNDGCGYPLGTRAENLSLEGQIVAMGSLINELYRHHITSQNLNIADMQVVLNIDSEAHGLKTYRALSSIIRHSKLKPRLQAPSTAAKQYATQLTQRSKALKEAVTILAQRQAFEQIKLVDQVSTAQILFKVTDRALHLTARSGLSSDEILQWLASIDDGTSPEEMREMAEVELLQNELKRQLYDHVFVFYASMPKEAFGGTFEYASLIAVLQDVESCLEKM